MRSHSLRGMYHVAVIGGNGFLGRAIIHRLSSHPNLRIFSIDKRIHNVYIPTNKSKAIIEQIHMDVANPGAIHGWLMAHPVDVIIYAAGFENPTDGLSFSYLDDAKSMYGLSLTLASLNDMFLTKEEERPYFMYLSSWSVYGSTRGLQKETSKEYPSNYSGMIKLTGEDLVKRICTKVGSPWSILRPAEIYGRHHNNELRNRNYWPGYLCYYLDKIVRQEKEFNIFSPNTKIDLVHINHFTKVVSEMIQQKLEGIYNITSGEVIKVKDLVDKLLIEYQRDTEFKGKLVYSNKLKIEHMNLCSNKVESLLPYDSTKYDLDEFISSYIPVRRYEIAKDLAIEDTLSEPVIIDMASTHAKEAYEARKMRRKLVYGKIKDIAGPEFFKIKVGRIQERYDKLIDLEETPELLELAQEEQKKNNKRLELLGATEEENNDVNDLK